ncbi:hypothetical protein QUA35_10115 [Microcoleus sp. N9_B2]|uniref:hypothetical protein n=2 Tax=Microcoleus TaxID=44471 RepID=UPI002FCEC48B
MPTLYFTTLNKMPPQKPIVPRVQPLGAAKDHYKLTGKPYDTNTVKIQWTPLKILGSVIVLGTPYAALIMMVYSSGLTVLAAIMVGSVVLIGGFVGLLYYLNREEPKPPYKQNQRR